jgi:L-alanine-DL-glutamate epimerase-like enolase superfamily enzyme
MVLRWPVAQPVRTSFGTMLDRPALLVRVEDTDGASGWGEVWCNFPGCGAEHRARLLDTVIAPLAVGERFASPEQAFERLSAATAVLAIQSGEPGPIAQAIAGLDLAIWDLQARRAGVPLWRLLGGRSGTVAVYASGINPDRPEDMVLARHAQGYRAFKLKIGFGEARDLANVGTVRDRLPAGATLMLDANQAWPLDTALRMAERLAAFAPAWLEEPLRADRPTAEWAALAAHTRIPLAAGENLVGEAAFATMIASGTLGVVQPDLAKWGGVSGCLPVIERIHAAGLRYCPHFLGAGIGQLASAHVLAARGRPGGMLEIDANENPLRTELSPALGTIRDGLATLGDTPGLGVEPDLARLRALCAEARDGGAGSGV